ncbi:MAG: tRNA-guanine transglycosylase, partial [Euryarchaeota archaeon]|nr:tRNA-guanine transglycosylase [Euryarchaeota archaeon]
MFEILKRDGLARICEFATPHGVLETPCLLPVVSPKLLTIPPEELYRDFGVRAVITNSYIIRGDDGLRKRALDEEIHALLGFPGTIMTDSGT